MEKTEIYFFNYEVAEIILLKLVQQKSFTIPEVKNLKAFQILTDSARILKIKSRLLLSECTMNFRLPVILPNEHSVVDKLIRSRYLNLGHDGIKIMLSSLREDCWILKFSETIRKIISAKCKRYGLKLIEISTPPLPENRVGEVANF